MFKRRRPYKTFLLLLFLLGLFFFGVDRLLRTTILNIAETKVVGIAIEAVNRSIQQKVWDNELQYQDFIQVQKDDHGRIVFMQANTVKVSRMAADIILVVNDTLQQMRGQTFAIPLGQITGLQLLSASGPNIKVTIIPVGAVQVNVEDKFEPAGINQTRHKIWLNFNTQVKVVIPSMSAEARVTTQVPLAESIIVGEVPSTFVNISGGIFGGGVIR